MMIDSDNPIVLTDAQVKSRRSRNIAVALICLGLVVLFYAITWAKFGSALADRAQ